MYTYNKCEYNTDFTVNNSGWQLSSNGSNRRALKWVGSSYTTDWIAYQPGCSISDICSRLYNATSNSSNKYHYQPGSTEVAYTDISDKLTLKPLSSSVTVGVGGACISKLTPKGNKLITKIKFSPHASGKSDYSSYSNTNTVTLPAKNSQGNYDCFYAMIMSAGTIKGILTIGNVFKATMTLSNGQTISKTVTGDSFASSRGWQSNTSNRTKELLSFDFGPDLNEANLPLGTYTTQITFETTSSGSIVICGLLLNGLVAYKN